MFVCVCVCVCVVRTLGLTVIENLKLTLVTVLYVRFLEPAHLIPECLHPWASISTPPHTPVSGSHHSALLL